MPTTSVAMHVLPLEILELILKDCSAKDAAAFISTCRAWYAARHTIFRTYEVAIPVHSGDWRQLEKQRAFKENAKHIRKLIVRERSPSVQSSGLNEYIHGWSERNIAAISDICSAELLENVRSIEAWFFVSTFELGTDPGLQFSIESTLRNWIFVFGRQIMAHCRNLREFRLVHRWINISSEGTYMPPILFDRQASAPRVESLMNENKKLLFAPHEANIGSMKRFTLDFAPICPEAIAISRLWTVYFQRSLVGVRSLDFNDDMIYPSKSTSPYDMFEIQLNNLGPGILEKLSIAVSSGAVFHAALSTEVLCRMNLAWPNLVRLELVKATAGIGEDWFAELHVLKNLKFLDIHGRLQLNGLKSWISLNTHDECDNTIDPVEFCDDHLLRKLCRIASLPPKLEVARLKMGLTRHYQCEVVRSLDGVPFKYKLWKRTMDEHQFFDEFPPSMIRLNDMDAGNIRVLVVFPNKDCFRQAMLVNYMDDIRPSRLYHPDVGYKISQVHEGDETIDYAEEYVLENGLQDYNYRTL